MTNAKREWITLANILLMTLMATLDSSIVTVALPVMSKSLNTNMGGIEWVVSSYTIAICATILIFGKLGDSIGKVKVFKFGIALFTLGSLICALSWNLPVLVVSRVIQGVGASASMATNQGLITENAPGGRRGRALGLGGTFAALGTMAGPTLGGLIVSKLPWGMIFLINLPVGTLAYILSIKFLHSSQSREKEPIDKKGAALMIFSLVLIFYSITLGQSLSFTNPVIITSLIIGILLVPLFVVYEKKQQNPVVQIDLFKNRLLSLSLFCSILSFLASGAINIILPFYLEETLNLSVRNAGLVLTVFPLILLFVGPISGAMSDKIGSEQITFAGLTVGGIGYLLVTTFTEQTPLYFVIICFIIISFGNALFQSPNTSLIMSSVQSHQFGIAGSLNSFARNFGITAGVAVFTSILYSFMSLKVGYPVNGYVPGRDDVFIYGMRWTFAIMAITMGIGATMTFIRMRNIKKLRKS